MKTARTCVVLVNLANAAKVNVATPHLKWRALAAKKSSDAAGLGVAAQRRLTYDPWDAYDCPPGGCPALECAAGNCGETAAEQYCNSLFYTCYNFEENAATMIEDGQLWTLEWKYSDDPFGCTDPFYKHVCQGEAWSIAEKADWCAYARGAKCKETSDTLDGFPIGGTPHEGDPALWKAAAWMYDVNWCSDHLCVLNKLGCSDQLYEEFCPTAAENKALLISNHEMTTHLLTDNNAKIAELAEDIAGLQLQMTNTHECTTELEQVHSLQSENKDLQKKINDLEAEIQLLREEVPGSVTSTLPGRGRR